LNGTGERTRATVSSGRSIRLSGRRFEEWSNTTSSCRPSSRRTSSRERRGDEILFQLSLGAEPLPFETASRISQKTLAQLAEIVGRHPKLRFQCFVSSRHANQTLCILCRELPNFSLAGFWWTTSSPARSATS
jgi:hypothetical protein